MTDIVVTAQTSAEPRGDPRDAWVSGFVGRLAERFSDTPRGSADRAAASQFGRAAGATLADRPGLCPLFYSLARDVPRWAEDSAFLVATLMPLGLRQENGKTVILPAAVADGRSSIGITFFHMRGILRRDRPDDDGSSLDKRFAILLDAPIEALPFRLRQAVRFALSKDAGVDWKRLLRDLLAWDHPSRCVQKQWARDYFGRGDSINNQSDAATQTADDTENEEE